MGNAEECTGSCRYEPLPVVGVIEHAAMLEALEQISECAERLTALVRQVAGVPANPPDAAETFRSLQQQARECLRTIPAASQERPADAAERVAVWLCRSCGHIEAPQQCLGICIRRSQDCVRASDHERVVQQMAGLWKRAGELRRLANLLSWVAPREGQLERTLCAFKLEARGLLSQDEPTLARAPDNADGPSARDELRPAR